MTFVTLINIFQYDVLKNNGDIFLNVIWKANHIFLELYKKKKLQNEPTK